MVVRGGDVVVIIRGIQTLGQSAIDLRNILLPYDQIYIVVPWDEAAVPHSPQRRPEMAVELYTVPLQNSLDVFVHRKESGLGLVHQHSSGVRQRSLGLVLFRRFRSHRTIPGQERRKDLMQMIHYCRLLICSRWHRHNHKGCGEDAEQELPKDDNCLQIIQKE
jgi:hypothetical protein